MQAAEMPVERSRAAAPAMRAGTGALARNDP